MSKRGGRRAALGAALALCLGGPWGGVLHAAPVPRKEPPGLDRKAEVERTWTAAVVALPVESGGYFIGRMNEPETKAMLSMLPPGRRFPTVVYAHGCSGMKPGNLRWIAVLAGAGYAVVAPDSFARGWRPPTCNPVLHRGIPGAPFRRVSEMRQEELHHAAERVRSLPWVDAGRLFLMGHSQGGTASAAYSGGDFRARIVSGSTCGLGVNGPPGEPVLSFYSVNDPWRRNRPVDRCRTRAEGREPPMEFTIFPGNLHNLAGNARARRLILGFLARHGGVPRSAGKGL